jgi:chromosome segregation ATPase
LRKNKRQRNEAHEAALTAQRRANVITGELEELRAVLEQTERARKTAETELHAAANRIGDVSTQNANLSSQRRQLESTIAAMQVDLDEAISELKNSEERSKKASSDASRLVEELCQEQDHALQVERLRKGLEQQVKDLQTRLDEPEGNSVQKVKNVLLLNLNNV